MNYTDSAIYRNDLDTALGAVVNLDQLNNKAVLITGATGTIGSFIVDMLLRYNHGCNGNIRVYAAGRSPERLKALFGEMESDGILYVAHDLLSPFELNEHVDYIIHAAGNAYPASFCNDAAGTILGNVYGTYNLLKYGYEHGTKRMLLISSGEVYGNIGKEAVETDDLNIGILGKRYAYPSSKQTAEVLCNSFCEQYGMETVVVRACHTIGPVFSKNDNRAHVQFLRKALEGEDIVLNSQGLNERSYIYIADCAAAILTVLLNGNSGDTYNISASDMHIRIRDLAEIIAKSAGTNVLYKEPDLNELGERSHIMRQVLCSKKLESLGWNSSYTIEEGVEHILKILKDMADSRREELVK